MIARAGKSYLQLVPYREKKNKRKLGGLEGQIWIAPDFDEPDEELVALFEQSNIFPDD